MGLSICRSIVEAHGGRIRAHALSQGGTAFEIELPAYDTPAKEPHAKAGSGDR
jgi:signal transduction histidine kinase